MHGSRFYSSECCGLWQTGGPSVAVPLGRRDGRVSSASSVLPNIIDTTFTLDEMLNHFSSKGLSLEDLVALSGTGNPRSSSSSVLLGELIFFSNAARSSHYRAGPL